MLRTASRSTRWRCPYNTTIFKEMRVLGQAVAPVADWPTKRGWVDYAFSEMEKAGYTIASAYTAVKDPATHPVSLSRPACGPAPT